MQGRVEGNIYVMRSSTVHPVGDAHISHGSGVRVLFRGTLMPWCEGRY